MEGVNNKEGKERRTVKEMMRTVAKGKLNSWQKETVEESQAALGECCCSGCLAERTERRSKKM
jgi:hypothetical protein